MKTDFGRTMMTRLIPAAVLALAGLTLVACAHSHPEPSAPAEFAQTRFDQPRDACKALVDAAERFDQAALLRILGPEAKDLVASSDPVRDRNMAEAFAAKAREKFAFEMDPETPDRAVIAVGEDEWPFPIPLVKKGNQWFFDSRAGHDEILYRRIGANELDAITVCRGFVEAQQEYAQEARDETGIPQYAQRIISTPGKRDGLYWVDANGIPGGPISQPIAQAIAEGYTAQAGTGYHGYYFKVLKGQGPSARGGELDYVIDGIMIGGFALAAVPVEYRVTGVKTFLVSHDGVVYEKDLGPDSLALVKAMERFDPDAGWTVTEDQWPVP
jgi:hypothetical protein